MSKSYGPILNKFNQIQIEENPWLWPGRIPLRAITILIGLGGEGKSFLACSVACAVSRGNPLADGAPAPQGNIVVMAGEDLPSKLRLRYQANGADLERVTLLEGSEQQKCDSASLTPGYLREKSTFGDRQAHPQRIHKVTPLQARNRHCFPSWFPPKGNQRQPTTRAVKQVNQLPT